MFAGRQGLSWVKSQNDIYLSLAGGRNDHDHTCRDDPISGKCHAQNESVDIYMLAKARNLQLAAENEEKDHLHNTLHAPFQRVCYGLAGFTQFGHLVFFLGKDSGRQDRTSCVTKLPRTASERKCRFLYAIPASADEVITAKRELRRASLA